jgi:hypothetical protein
VLRVEPAVARHDRFGHVHAGRGLGTRLARLKCVQAHPGDDRREPAAEILDPIDSCAADAQPRILNRFIGFRERAQHPIGHGSEVRSMLLEAFGKPVAFIHGRSLVHLIWMTVGTRSM